MVTDELKENIKRHYGDSDEDLSDLAAIMDALDDLDKLDDLKSEIETLKLEAEAKIKSLDNEWRTRYRERFFDGDVQVDLKDELDESTDDENPEDISIDEYVESITKEGN